MVRTAFPPIPVTGIGRGWRGTFGRCLLVATLAGAVHAAVETPEKTTPAASDLPPGAVLSFGSSRFHQGYGVTSLAFLPDGQAVVVGGTDGGVRVMDLATGTVRSVLREGKPEGGRYRQNCFALSPDGQTLAFWEPNGEREVTRIEVATGKVLSPWPLDDLRGPTYMRFSPDGKLLAVLGDRGFVVLRAADRRVMLEWSAPTRLLSSHSSCLAFSPDSALLLAASEGRAVAVWEISAKKEILRYDGHDYRPSAAGFLPDGQAVTMDGKQIRIWQPRTGETSRANSIGWCFVQELAITPDGATVVFLNNNAKSTRAFETAKLTELYTIPRPTATLSALALSPDGKCFVYGDESGALGVHETATGKPLLSRTGHDGPVLGLAFSPDGRWIATGGQDRCVYLWDRANGSAHAAMKGSRWAVKSLAFSRDGRTLASSDADCVHSWEVPAGGLVRMFGGHDSNTVTALRFSPDDKVLATGDDHGEVRAWNAATGEMTMRARALENNVGALAFNPDGSRVFAGLTRVYSGNDAVCLETTTGKEAFRVRSSGHLGETALSADGTRLAGARQSGAVCVWELRAAGADEIITFQPHKGEIERLAFSPNGWFLVTGNGAGEIVVSEVVSGQPVAQVGGLGSPVSSLHFSPEGAQFASGLNNGTTLLWDWRKLVRLQDGPLPANVHGDLAGLWELLLDDRDARRACHAALEMAAADDDAVAWLRERVPSDKTAREDAKAHLAALDHEEFAQREAATGKLIALGTEFPFVADMVRRLHEDTDASEEVRMRTELIVKALASASAKQPSLRRQRAMQVLEWIGTAAAKKALKELVGDSAARQSW
jgi:WD40 repeat protein